MVHRSDPGFEQGTYQPQPFQRLLVEDAIAARCEPDGAHQAADPLHARDMDAAPGSLREGGYGVAAHRRFHSPRAAGELRHVFLEGLGDQLQPFHHGQIGEQLIGELFDRHPRIDRERRRLNEFTRLRRHGLHAD